MVVEIAKLDNYGRGITYFNEKIVFVYNTLVGEVVKIKIINENKKYCEAIVLEYIKISKERIDSPCIYSKDCGGCQLLHMNYNLECSFKEEKVKDILNKYANVSCDKVLGLVSDNFFNYRIKITLHGSNGRLGLYKENTNEIIEINECLLVSEKINKIIKVLRVCNKNIVEAVIKVSHDLKYSMVKITGEVMDISSLKEIVDVLIINDKYYTDTTKITTVIGEYKYNIGIDSFFQVNMTVTKLLYDEVASIISKIKPKNVLDLYCGTGTIGIYVSKYCKLITGIDYNKSNISDAIENKELNKINNISFICSRVEDYIDKFKDIDLIIVDPPRRGLDKKTRSYLKSLNNLKSIIYVSCDVITLSRDIKVLSDVYEVVSVKPFNMFPRTYHCETISVLERK